MAEEQAKGQAAETAPASTGKRKQTLLMLGILLFVMAAEGGGIYFAVKTLGGGPSKVAAEGLVSPTSSGGHGGAGGESETAKDAELSQDVELPVAKLRAPNMKSGRLFLYDLEVFAKTGKEKANTLKKLLEGSKATIEDRLSRVVRSADPQDLQEDGLETIRRQVKHEISQVVGDEKIVEEILIPKCTPFKVDY